MSQATDPAAPPGALVPENQPAPQGDRALWSADQPLSEAVARFGGDADHLAAHAARLGTPDMAEAAREANRQPPELRLFDRGGRRLDQVVFARAYHDFLALGLGAGYAARPWQGGAGGHVTHAAMVYLHSRVEPGTCCPMTMTYAAMPLLDAPAWRDAVLAARYDPADAPLPQKAGATIGMAMTEKQGGSDLRGTVTTAAPDGGRWRLHGHKWFCSAPMSDGFLTLAQAPGGLTCFLVPRWRADGSRNAIRLQRLKDKLGNRANASAEIEYHGAEADLVGAPGEGVRTIIAMVHHTRLDTAVAPAGLMRAALSEALWWCEGRSAFGRRLIDQPLMRRVLADLALEVEAATALAFRAAAAFDDPTPEARALARITVALAKFMNNKRCPVVVAEAMEALGGMGYAEDTALPLLYREAPLNGIWEGSGNVICLDILRTLSRDPAAAHALAAVLDDARGADRRYDAALDRHRALWPGPPDEAEARRFAAATATLLASAELIRHAPAAVADAFVATRLDAAPATVPGAIGPVDTQAIIRRLGPR